MTLEGRTLRLRPAICGIDPIARIRGIEVSPVPLLAVAVPDLAVQLQSGRLIAPTDRNISVVHILIQTIKH
jgi:hypothetical protein